MDKIKEKYMKYKKKYVKRKEEIRNQKDLTIGKVETKNVLSEYNLLGTGLNSNTGNLGTSSINTGISAPSNILSQYNITPSMSSLSSMNKQPIYQPMQQVQQPMQHIQQPMQRVQQPIQQVQQPMQHVQQPIQQVQQPMQHVQQPIQNVQQVQQSMQPVQQNFNEKYNITNWQQELKKKYEMKIEGELKQIKETRRNERREEIERVIKEREEIENKIEKLKIELEGQIKTELGEKIKVLEKEYLDEYNKFILSNK